MRLQSLELMRGYTVARLQARPLSLGLAESAVACRFLALRRAQTRLLLATCSQACYGLPERLVLHSCVDFGRGNVPVAERSLHQTEVASLSEEPHGEGMAQRVDGKVPGDASYFKPVLESELDLARAKPIGGARVEEWRSVDSVRSIDALPEQSAKPSVEEHGFFASAFDFDCDGPFGEVDVTDVQSDERAEPHPGTEQEREHRVVSARNCSVGSGNRGEQRLRLIGRQVAGRSSIRRCRVNQPRRILAEVASLSQKPEEHSQGSLGPVDSERRLWLTVPVGKEACECVGSDRRDVSISLEPSFELPQIPQVSLPRALTFAISPELRVKCLDGYRELHGFTSLRVDSQATSMNALSANTVNSIMRRICEIRHFQAPLPYIPRGDRDTGRVRPYLQGGSHLLPSLPEPRPLEMAEALVKLRAERPAAQQ